MTCKQEFSKAGIMTELWCENATNLTKINWQYLKVPQKEFEGLHPSDFEELTIGLSDTTLL